MIIHIHQTGKITAGQTIISNRHDNSRTDEYIHQIDKITAGQLNISDRQNNSRTDEFIRQTR